MAAENPAPQMRLADFLETVPPGAERQIDGQDWKADWKPVVGGVSRQIAIDLPVLSLYCGEPSCDDSTFFDPPSNSNEVVYLGLSKHVFWSYHCRHCRKWIKTFALRLRPSARNTPLDQEALSAFKLGETPPFGPPLSAKLLQVAGTHADLLKKGRQCENHGLGIGAFAYYRRVVELQKGRLIDEIEAGMKKLGADQNALKPLSDARVETQFSKAIDMIASALPKELFVGGHNPLTLLHTPLSVGIHALSDQDCLHNAHHIRIVLTEMLDRIATITRESVELAEAIKHLVK